MREFPEIRRLETEIWAPGACFQRARAREGKLVWHSGFERLVILLEARRLLLDPYKEEDFEFIDRLYDWNEYVNVTAPHRIPPREWAQECFWHTFCDWRRKESKRHLLDVLYVKYLDQKIHEEIYPIRHDPFYTGRLIL
jgi:hypothetical protein